LAGWNPLRPNVFPVLGPRSFGYAPRLDLALRSANADLAHVHGLWTYPSLAAHRWARQQRRRYLITVHGMLSPWALSVSRLKKKLASLIFENGVLRKAGCLHAVSTSELGCVRSHGLKNAVCVIPNGVELPSHAPLNPPPWSEQIESGQKVLLYLGRLHPIKGLPALIEAWADFRRQGGASAREWRLAIGGWGQHGHEDELKHQVHREAMTDSVHFLGPLFGEAKSAALHRADALVLASHSEGLPTVVLEAWAHERPVLMTPECSLPEGFASGSALRIGTTPHAILEGLQHLISMSDRDRRAMGERGRALVEERFSWPKIAADMRAVYSWLLGGGSPPSCVSTA
jgi:poly(glycerol-phosphate) alpha-glucosyltransferase